MKEFQVSNHNIQNFMEELQSEINEHKVVIVSSQAMNTGKWGMAKLWRAWMSTTAKFMAEKGATMPLRTVNNIDISENGLFSRALFKLKSMLGSGHNLTVTYGVRPFDANDAHELFTRQWLGVDENGTRLSWAKSGDQRKATKGERFNALFKHEHWCLDKGIILFKPRGSEYDELEKKQNE